MLPHRHRRAAVAGLLLSSGLVVSCALALAFPHLVSVALGMPARVYTRWFPPAPPPQLPGMSELERGAWRVLGRQVNGRLLWSSNRAGNHDLYLVDLSTGAERQLTDHSHVDFLSRFSPDGRYISFLRSQKPWVSIPRRVGMGSLRDACGWNRGAEAGRGGISPNLAPGWPRARVRVRESHLRVRPRFRRRLGASCGQRPADGGPDAAAGARS